MTTLGDVAEFMSGGTPKKMNHRIGMATYHGFQHQTWESDSSRLPVLQLRRQD